MMKLATLLFASAAALKLNNNCSTDQSTDELNLQQALDLVKEVKAVVAANDKKCDDNKCDVSACNNICNECDCLPDGDGTPNIYVRSFVENPLTGDDGDGQLYEATVTLGVTPVETSSANC